MDYSTLSHPSFAGISSLIPSLFKTANAAMNVSIASKLSNGSIYQAVLPSGAKLAASHSMNDAVRGFYLGENGIAGQANFKKVDISKMATMYCTQYLGPTVSKG